MHKYECKLDIKDVYVDPLVWNGNLQGAVYIETDKNIPVEENSHISASPLSSQMQAWIITNRRNIL